MVASSCIAQGSPVPEGAAKEKRDLLYSAGKWHLNLMPKSAYILYQLFINYKRWREQFHSCVSYSAGNTVSVDSYKTIKADSWSEILMLTLTL